LAIIAKIQFTPAGKLYDFDSAGIDLHAGDRVVVETERGKGIGTIIGEPAEPEGAPPEGLKKVLRKATPDDLSAVARNAAREKEAFAFCLRKITERGMQMKLVRVEYLFDGSKAIFYFTADGRIDFRDLVKDLAHAFHTRIEMRQIGVRDEAKMVGGLGICGRELCCSSFLRDFEPVSVKMAKEQNLALNPTKISGQCGRLLCCLGYEFDTYCNLKKCLPKCGKMVKCGDVTGEVVKMNILQGTVTLRTEDQRNVTVSGDDIKPEDISERQKKPLQREPEPQKKPGKDGQRREGQGPRRNDRRDKDRDKKEKP
jgi:cell fate regulator YaaT (PSP1 superfamily)